MIVKYKNSEYDIHDYGRIVYKRIGNLKNPACPYYVLDQIDGETYVKEKEMDEYLKNKYNFTAEQYYNLVVNGNPDEFYRCPNCGKRLEFKGFRFQGHGGYRYYCNSKCQGEHYVKIGISNFQLKREKNEQVASDRMKRLNKQMLEDGMHPLQDKNVIIKRTRNEYRYNAKKYGWTHAYFYLAFYTGDYSNFKIGITQSISGRMGYSKFLGLEGGYSTIHKIRYGSVYDISELEYQIKMKFIDYSVGSYEVFPMSILSEVIKFIRNS